MNVASERNVMSIDKGHDIILENYLKTSQNCFENVIYIRRSFSDRVTTCNNHYILCYLGKHDSFLGLSYVSTVQGKLLKCNTTTLTVYSVIA